LYINSVFYINLTHSNSAHLLAWVPCPSFSFYDGESSHAWKHTGANNASANHNVLLQS